MGAEPCLPVPALPAIVLAAGLSTRMKQFKPLMMLGEKTLLQHVMDSLQQSDAIGEIVVVTGHRHADVERAVGGLAGVRTVFNARYEQGEMLSSVHAGIGALAAGASGGNGLVLAFADQPAVLSPTVRTLVKAFAATHPPLAIPRYQGRRGHPLVFSGVLVPEIQALCGQETLRTVVHRHLAEAVLVEVDDPSVLEDLDTPEDFARAQARHQQSAPGEAGRKS